MTCDTEKHRQHVLTEADARKEFVTLEDGFVYYWPDEFSKGAFSAFVLRWIADELDKRNAEWEATLARELGRLE